MLVLVAAMASISCGAQGPDAWSREQIEAFESFRDGSSEARVKHAPRVAAAFPVAFSFDRLAVLEDREQLISESELFALIGQPTRRFALDQQPDYLGIGRRKSLVDPKDLHVFVYDIDCLREEQEGGAGPVDVCSTLEALSWRGSIVRVVVSSSPRQENIEWLNGLPQ